MSSLHTLQKIVPSGRKFLFDFSNQMELSVLLHFICKRFYQQRIGQTTET